jgi:hypothetical protein
MKPLPQENLFLWVKQQEHEIDHLSTSNIKVKMRGVKTPNCVTG